MTPGARVAAAIEILDDLGDGVPAEQALTRWARRSRFAGSKDRAAIRDHVFDVLRCKRTAAHYGQGETGRALMIGLLHQQDADLGALFHGEGHAPSPLTPSEARFPAAPTDEGTLWNLPDWMLPAFKAALPEGAAQAATHLQTRAPITLRTNLSKTTRGQAIERLAEEGISAVENALSTAALTVLDGSRKIRNSQAFSEGYVELQDAASQAIVESLPKTGRILDYCAGGGGKSLGLAMHKGADVFAHDIAPARMKDLPARAARAGARVVQLETAELGAAGPFDVVLCDAPCSGSGAWRRAAEGKWTLTPERLDTLNDIQDDILAKAARLVAPKGLLAYATCSLFRAENEDRVDHFLSKNPSWKQVFSRRFSVDAQGDGFFIAHLRQEIS